MQKIKKGKSCGKRLLVILLAAAVFAGAGTNVHAAEVDIEKAVSQIRSEKEVSEPDETPVLDEEQEETEPEISVTWKKIIGRDPKTIETEPAANGIKLSWKVSKKAKKYEVYRKKDGEKTYTLIKTTKKGSYTDTNVAYGVTYLYKVCAILEINGKKVQSQYSNTKKCCTHFIDPAKPMVALTYDDGPSQYTAQILDLLQKYNSRATFFEVGNRVGLYPQAVKRIAEMNCELGNHSYDHTNLGTASVATIQSQLGQTNSKIKSIAGKEPALVRPPYGSIGSNLRNYANKPLILWSIDTLDWKTRNATSVYNSVMSHVKDGDIILMHDLYRSTLDASARIIPELKKRGYQLVTVSELAKYKNVTLRAGQSYSQMR